MGGVAISATTRSTDIVLGARLRSEVATSSLADTAADQLASVEAVFGEPGTTGLAAQLDMFWNAWGMVALDPNSSANCAGLLRAASSVTSTLNTFGGALAEIADAAQRSLGADVDTLNATAARLAEINGQMTAGSGSGAGIEAVLGERDALLVTLSGIAGAIAELDTGGSATISLGGVRLVDGSIAGTATLADDGTVTLDGTAVAVTTGSIGARASLLDGSLPAYRSTLDAVASAVANAVNDAQAGGFDRTGGAGIAMFAGTTATDITVVLTDPAGVAAGVSSGGLDNRVATSLSQAALRPGSADSIFAALVGNVAASSAAAAHYARTRGAVRDYVGNLRRSMAGVGDDEAAATMLAYQQAFGASSRVLTAIDAMLDTLIAHTGTVRRS